MLLFAAVANPWLFALIGIAVLKLIIDGERLFFLRDSILKQVYEENRALWFELGKPTGRLWRPPGNDNANVMRGTLNRALWREGSRIAEYSRVEEKFRKQIAIGWQLVRVDAPLLLVGVALVIIFSAR